MSFVSELEGAITRGATSPSPQGQWVTLGLRFLIRILSGQPLHTWRITRNAPLEVATCGEAIATILGRGLHDEEVVEMADELIRRILKELQPHITFIDRNAVIAWPQEGHLQMSSMLTSLTMCEAEAKRMAERVGEQRYSVDTKVLITLTNLACVNLMRRNRTPSAALDVSLQAFHAVDDEIARLRQAAGFEAPHVRMVAAFVVFATIVRIGRMPRI